jgi:hypothetical protein
VERTTLSFSKCNQSSIKMRINTGGKIVGAARASIATTASEVFQRFALQGPLLTQSHLDGLIRASQLHVDKLIGVRRARAITTPHDGNKARAALA